MVEAEIPNMLTSDSLHSKEKHHRYKFESWVEEMLRILSTSKRSRKKVLK